MNTHKERRPVNLFHDWLTLGLFGRKKALLPAAASDPACLPL